MSAPESKGRATKKLSEGRQPCCPMTGESGGAEPISPLFYECAVGRSHSCHSQHARVFPRAWIGLGGLVGGRQVEALSADPGADGGTAKVLSFQVCPVTSGHHLDISGQKLDVFSRTFSKGPRNVAKSVSKYDISQPLSREPLPPCCTFAHLCGSGS